jgi:hypothetical protein
MLFAWRAGSFTIDNNICNDFINKNDFKSLMKGKILPLIRFLYTEVIL